MYWADVQAHGIFLSVWMCYLNPFQHCLLLEVMKQFSPACAQWLFSILCNCDTSGRMTRETLGLALCMLKASC